MKQVNLRDISQYGNQDIRQVLFRLCEGSLLKEFKLSNSCNPKRDQLFDALEQCAYKEPEFVWQLAYYLRNKYQIRTATNFILGFATYYDTTKQYAQKYFNKCIKLPSDLVEVCQYHQVNRIYLDGKLIGYGQDYARTLETYNIRQKMHFSKCLRKSIKLNFDLYQIGKHCSDSKRKRLLHKYREAVDYTYRLKQVKKRKLKSKKKDEAYSMLNRKQKRSLNRKKGLQMVRRIRKAFMHYQPPKLDIYSHEFLCMKDIIKRCHVSKPKMAVMMILGKKYPKTKDEFHAMFGDQDHLVFQQNQVGKRMKLPVPITWDRKLSKEGNTAKVWQELIETNSIPYYALLKNIRNILQAGLKKYLHERVIQIITNKDILQNKSIWPLSIYRVIKELNNIQLSLQPQIKKTGKRKNKQQQEHEQVAQIKANQNHRVDPQMIQLYQSAFSTVLDQIINALPTISGITYIISNCWVLTQFNQQDNNQLQLSAEIIRQLIRMKCESCQFYLFSNKQNHRSSLYERVNFTNQSLDEAIQKVNQQETEQYTGNFSDLGQTIYQLLVEPNQQADTVILILDLRLAKQLELEHKKDQLENVFEQYIAMYPNANFYVIDISGSQVQLEITQKSPNITYINAISEKIIQLIATRSTNFMEEIIKASAHL